MSVHKVIDSNFLQCEPLRRFLAKSPEHFAVLTDYSAIEAYKAETPEILFRDMEILSHFPKQVIVLKGTQVVCGLSGRPARLQKRLVDRTQTQGFAEFCRHLAAARGGNTSVQKQFSNHAREARHQMQRMLIDAAKFKEGLQEITKAYQAGELRIIRTVAPHTDEMLAKFTRHLLITAAFLFKDHPGVEKKIPDIRHLPNTFIFRIALCMHLLAHRWISVGGAGNVKPERIRNDLVDVNFAAYATYFDGILSNDKKVNDIYKDAVWMLRNIFLPPPAQV
jgi:hypothetical protein